MRGFIRYLSLISAVALLSYLSLGREARAGCAPAPSIKDDVLSCNVATPPDPTAATVNASKGNDQITVDSGTYTGGFDGGAGNDTFTLIGGIIGSITDTVGLRSTLILTPGSNATITGNVTFDETLDRLEVHAGTISGHVEQGIGVDTLIMTGGVIGSIAQGVGRDHATVSGGRIIGEFTDGDIFTMTGGRIGSVDLRTGTNIMRMSGGQIDLNVNAEQADDTLELSGGSIGGNVNFGSGDDKITVTGGAIGGQVLTEAGTDSFTWADGGTIGGAVDLGADNDGAILRNLTNALLSSTSPIDGNLGTDRLTFENTVATDVGRFQRWETVDLTNGSQLTLDTNLTLGDAGTGTGSLSIDATSTLFAGGGDNSILPFTSGQLASVANGGTIDLTNGGPSATDSLTIVGNYSAGSNLLLNTVLGADGSPSDKLVIESGAATGNTTIGVVKVGGAGALTTSDGILVVEAVNGATTAGDAFAQGNRVAAGAFEYLLFRGGVAGAAPDNWHLRSALVPGSAPPAARGALAPRAAPAPGEPVAPPAPGEPAAPLAPAPLPAPPAPPAPGEPAIPLLRPEVPVYSAVLPTARALGILTLDAFHERQGEQRLLQGTGVVPAAWGRAFGEKREDSWSGLAAPEFDGTLFGFQAGLDLAGFVSSRGDERDHLGVFVGYARADGDIDGFAVGQQMQVGDLGFNAYSIGAYGTHIGPGEWYLDAVLMGTFFDGKASSDFGAAADPDGTGVTASLEGGYPIALGAGLTLEPQAQITWQHLDLDDTADAISTVEYDTADTFIGRVGARLQGEVQAGSVPLQPYVKLNLWQQVGGDDAVIFGGANEIETKNRMTAIEVGAGIVAKVSESVGLYAVVDYTTDIADNDTEVIQGNLGVRVTW
ncbi:MAG: autotransporter outer membrane beta-barrel domain-containing protein [Chromatiales bacterium]